MTGTVLPVITRVQSDGSGFASLVQEAKRASGDVRLAFDRDFAEVGRMARQALAMENPSPELLRELLDYNPESGLLTWRKRTGKYSGSFNSCFAGKPAGTLRSDGYIALKVQNVIYAAHRVIWAMMHGEWPECVCHLNRNDADNRLANLEAMTRLEVNRTRIATDRPCRHKVCESGVEIQ